MLKNAILDLIKSSNENKDNFDDLNNIFTLYEQLQFSSNLKQMAEDIYDWLNKTFFINNVTISLFDIDDNKKEDIFVKGELFFLDDDMSLFFIINTHTKHNAIISFSATSKEHYNEVQNKYELIQSAFFLISPILQSGIIKKNYIQSHSIDSVTNVYNRKYLTKHLNKLISLSGKDYKSMYFLMIGIDRFKAVTDEFDYDVGDKVLIELAKVIHSNISEFDLVARIIGDEFLISMVEPKTEDEIKIIAQKIIDDFAKVEVDVNDNAKLKKTICIGYDKFDESSESIDSIIKNADTALYEAKNRGRNILQNFKEIVSEDEGLELF